MNHYLALKRKFPRTLNEAFPCDANAACAVHVTRKKPKVWPLAVLVAALFAAGYFYGGEMKITIELSDGWTVVQYDSEVPGYPFAISDKSSNPLVFSESDVDELIAAFARIKKFAAEEPTK